MRFEAGRLSGLCALAAGVPVWLERLLGLIVCWQLAGLVWLLCAPASGGFSLSLPHPIAEDGAQSQQARAAFTRWYGATGNAGSDVLGEYRLIAVIAGKDGAAILKDGERSIAVRVGQEIRPGSQLVAVEPTRIGVDQAGVRKELRLPQPKLSGESLISQREQKSPAKHALPPIRLTRGQLAAMIQDSNLGSWDKGFATAAEGGIRIEDAAAQPLAQLLQFRNGDLLKSVNQRPLEQVADISLLSHSFGQFASVDLVLIRNAVSLTQHYDIQP